MVCLNRSPLRNVKRELGVGRDKGGGRKPGSRGSIISGEDKVQDGAEGRVTKAACRIK